MPKMLSEHFSEAEFACHDGCGKLIVSPRLISLLELARSIYGGPMSIESGYRCPAHNAAVGSKPDSAHVTGEAADIRVAGSWNRKKLAKALDSVGFPRLGLATDFIHADVSTTLPEGWWTYD